MTLNLEAAKRQTLNRPRPAARVEELLGGFVTISPHPRWQLPDSPTWTEDPFSDRNWTFQYHMLRWLAPLLWEADAGNDDAWEMWLSWTISWVRANLDRPSPSEWAWKDMSDGIRAALLCSAAPVMAERAPEMLAWLESAIRVHADHLAESKNIGNANHALHQHESLFIVGRVLDDAQLWTLATNRIDAHLRAEYDEQGINAEGAIAYHHNNYLWWERTLRRFDLEGVPRPEGAHRLKKAPIGLAHATRPTGTYTSIGDTDAGTSPRALKSPFSTYVASNGRKGALPSGLTPNDTVAVYDAGYIFSRSGWGSLSRPFSKQTFYSLRFGPSKRVHGHHDGTSITFTADGVDWITDPGKYDYSSSDFRKHLISRDSHTVLRIRDKRPRTATTAALTRQTVTDTHHDFVIEDDSYRGIDLRRRVIYSRSGEYLVVVDDASSSREITAEQHWQLAPGVKAMNAIGDNECRVILGHEKHRVAIIPLTATERAILRHGKEGSDEAWVSTGWKKKERSSSAIIVEHGRTISILTVIAVGRGIPPRASFVETTDGTKRSITINRGGGFVETIEISEDDVSITTDAPPERN